MGHLKFITTSARTVAAYLESHKQHHTTGINDLKVSAQLFFCEHEQYQRHGHIVEGTKALEEKGRNSRLIIYPGVGRGFDFRPPSVRTFADDLAAKDAARRTERFIRHHLKELYP